MRYSTSWSVRVIGVLLTVSARVEASPILPHDINVGARVTGSFSIPISGNPPDVFPDDPRFGYYQLHAHSARMFVTVDDLVFSSTPGDMSVRVHDQRPFDWIQVHSNRQSPQQALELTFRFPPDVLTSDAFPKWIDPLATIPPARGIIGSVGGPVGPGATRWSFGFYADPLTMIIAVSGGTLTGTYSGTIFHVMGVPEPVPEPATMVLVMSGLFALRRMTRHSQRRALSR